MDYSSTDHLYLDYQKKLFIYLQKNKGNEESFILNKINEYKIKIKEIEDYSIKKEEKKVVSKFPFTNEKYSNNYENYLSQVKKRASDNFIRLKNTLPQLKKHLDFYETSLKRLKIENIKELENKNKIEWIASELDLVELIKSLIEIKAINYKTEQDVFEFFEKIFDIKLKKRQRLQTIKERKKDKSNFIPKLEQAFLKWFDKEL